MLKAFLAAALSVLLSACVTVNAGAPPLGGEVGLASLTRAEAHSKRVTYKVTMDPADVAMSYCGGTAIGPAAIVSAAHCTEHIPGNVVLLDGREVVVAQVLIDDMDHAILILKDYRFTAWAKIGRVPEVGDQLHMWGNSLFDSFLRRGYVTTFVWNQPYIQWPVGTGWMVTDMQVSGGDSGSGMFNAKGELVALVTGYQRSGTSVYLISMPFNFPGAAVHGVVPEPRNLDAIRRR